MPQTLFIRPAMFDFTALYNLLDNTLLLLALAGFLAGFIDSIAGGGGLITIPVLIISGMNPITALGTNKLQGLFGSATATITYARGGHVNLQTQLHTAFLSFLGAAIGAYTATLISPKWFLMILPFILIAIAIYFVFKRDLSDEDKQARITPILFAVTMVPAIGFYDGIFGPGTGSFFMLAFVSLAGYGVLKATAHTKLLNFASNLGAFVIFMGFGAINWKIGIIMGIMQIAGAKLGANMAMKNGSKIIKPLLVITCTALAIKLFMD